jgi:hypothetical protein
MPRRRITFETVKKLGLELPGVELSTMYGVPALKLKGHLLGCVPTNKAAEPDSLVVRIDFEQREGLLSDAPETYYVKPHYIPYPCVLVRLNHIDQDALKELLHASWQFVSSRSQKRSRGKVRKVISRS